MLSYIEELLPDATHEEKLALSHEFRVIVRAWWDIASRMIAEEEDAKVNCQEGEVSASVESMENA